MLNVPVRSKPVFHKKAKIGRQNVFSYPFNILTTLSCLYIKYEATGNSQLA